MDALDDPGQRLAGLFRKLGAVGHAAGRFLDQRGDFLGGGAGALGVFPDLVGDDGKAEAVLPGPARAASIAASPH
jgi:hypothetical protein